MSTPDGFSPDARTLYDAMDAAWRAVAHSDYPWLDCQRYEDAFRRDRGWSVDRFTDALVELMDGRLVIMEWLPGPTEPRTGIQNSAYAPTELPPPWRQGGA